MTLPCRADSFITVTDIESLNHQWSKFKALITISQYNTDSKPVASLTTEIVLTSTKSVSFYDGTESKRN